MTDEDPLSIVQVRYARGEIDTAEYEEFLSWFLKNISFQQVPSLKIASERYANGELSIAQYKEIISHLLNDISNYQQSAPLRVIHLRYAEGEIDTAEFEEKVGVLMKDIPAYPYSPPLAVLFLRFAKGDIDNLRYQEMLNHLATYCTPTLPKETVTPAPEPAKPPVTPPKTGTPPVGQKPAAAPPSTKPPEAPSSPDPYRLNFAAVQNTSPTGSVSAGPSQVHAAMDAGIQAGGELNNLGAVTEVMADQQVMIQSATDVTAKRGSYHITDISSSPAPVTVLVKPEMDSSKKEATISFKQNTQEVIAEDVVTEESDQEIGTPESGIQSAQSEQIPGSENIISEIATSPSGNHQKIKALIKQGKYQESITRLDEMLKQAPDDYRSLFLKSIALFNIGKGDEALDILSKAKESCTNKEDAKEIERIYSHIVQKGNSKSAQKKEVEIRKDSESETEAQKEPSKMPSLTHHPDRMKNEHSENIEKICEQAQGLIDTGDYKGANEILADIQTLIKDIPSDMMEKESIDDLFAAKGFVLYQLKEFCEAKKFFKEATRINPKNETAIHYLNDIRVRDCNKFVRHV